MTVFANEQDAYAADSNSGRTSLMYFAYFPRGIGWTLIARPKLLRLEKRPMGSFAPRRMALVITDRAQNLHTGQMALSGPAASATPS